MLLTACFLVDNQTDSAGEEPSGLTLRHTCRLCDALCLDKLRSNTLLDWSLTPQRL